MYGQYPDHKKGASSADIITIKNKPIMSYPFQIKSYDEYKTAWRKSVDDPEGFWSDVADTFLWKKRWDKVLEWNFKAPDIKWFIGGKMNITENCLDRHLENSGSKPAIIWESNDPEEH